jgi:2-oxoglutarate ferredoxin oxidoreductase subunit alpha
MHDFSILIGGCAGDGINQAGLIIGRIFTQLNYRAYVYFDYPSLIRGGHNFSLIRISEKKITTHRNKVNFLLALNEDTVNLHKEKLTEESFIIYNSDLIKSKPENFNLKNALGLPLEGIIKELNAPPVMRNSSLIGAFCKIMGIDLLF